MDWNEVTPELAKKLDPKHVKGRKQGGGTVQYIEGWHAIAEMNAIFGFGAWDRETVELRQLGEPREVDGKMRVEYLARVRVTVWEDGGRTVRDGCGFGQGIDRDVGQAHESALKEAETDAMKRAMMTFGNRFGLALYDKSRENVGVDTPADLPAEQPQQKPARLEQTPHEALRAKLLRPENIQHHDKPAFQADLEALRKMNPEAAAQVEVRIGQLQQEQAA